MPMTNHKSPNNDLVLPPPPNYLHSTQNQQINRPPPPYKGMHIISKTKFLILVYYFQYTNFLMHYIFLVVYLLYVPRALYYQTIFVHYFQCRYYYFSALFSVYILFQCTILDFSALFQCTTYLFLLLYFYISMLLCYRFTTQQQQYPNQ